MINDKLFTDHPAVSRCYCCWFRSVPGNSFHLQTEKSPHRSPSSTDDRHQALSCLSVTGQWSQVVRRFCFNGPMRRTRGQIVTAHSLSCCCCCGCLTISPVTCKQQPEAVSQRAILLLVLATGQVYAPLKTCVAPRLRRLVACLQYAVLRCGVCCLEITSTIVPRGINCV